jgi:type III secretory pathway component EscS
MEILNVIAAALGAFAFGAVWYIAMSKPWVKAAGIPVDAAGKPQGNGSAMPFVIGLLAILVTAGMMRHVFQMAGVDTLGEGIGAGLGIGAFLITPWVGMNYAFSMRPLALWLIDSVNAVAASAIMGAILVLF